MTKLSDALRGAADRAPVDGVSIHADVTARRVVRQRGLRGAANGLVGVGAVTLLAVGIMVPGIGIGDGAGAGDAPMSPAKDGTRDNIAGPYAEDSLMRTGYGMCGAFLGDLAWGEPHVSLTATVEGAAGTELEGGSTVDVTVITTALRDVNLIGEPAVVFVLWEGMVVAQVPWDDYVASELALGAGETSDTSIALTLNNCWDGAPLPGGKYEVVVNQAFFGASSEPVPSEPVEPLPEPAPVEPTPTADADGAVKPGATDDDMMFIGGSEIYFTVGAVAGTIVVAGDVPADPFDQYIPKQLTADDLPANYLSPELARELFLAGVTNESWSMAAGTSRWVMRENSGDGYQEDTWARNYYGCVWDDSYSGDFPARSAELDLLSYTASIPSTVSVSYGWVVNGNPLINVALTNTSDYAIPGFYGQPSSELYLVRDGRIVAEAYPANVDRNGGMDYWAEPYAQGGIDAALANLGLLDPGASLTGQYLWREVNGCWTERGGQGLVEPGTYTVLSAQSLYITSGINDYYGDMYAEERSVSSEGGDTGEAMIEPAPMPSPGWDSYYQYTDLQMWTSLGTVTITN